MQLKILFVHDGPLHIDGASRIYGVSFNNRLVERYLNLGDQVSFLTRLQFIKPHLKGELNLINHPAFKHIEFPNFKSPVKNFTLRQKAKKIIYTAVGNNDIVVARMPSASGTLAIQAAREKNIPYLVEMVACTFDGYWNYNWKGKIIAHYKLWQQQKIIRACPHIIYVTKQFLQNRYPTKGKSINCSNVEIEDIDKADLTKKLNCFDRSIADDTLVIGTVAALNVPYKGQDDVIRAIRKLKKQKIKIKYRLVGQGSSERLKEIALKLGVLDEVEIIGSLKHSQVFEFLESIDLYIQPSKQEGLPRALIEAMSKACPALGARTAGIPELLDSKCVFKPGDVKEIADKLRTVDQKWLIEQSKRNFEVSKTYDKGVLEKRRLLFYDEFLSDNGLESR